jgi:hypothetical protein
MPSAFRDPKTLPDWVELDYHARRRTLGRWLRRLTVGVLLGLTLVMATSIVGSMTTGQTASWYQAGPVSPGHAMFQNDCSRCHTEPFRTALRFSPVHAGMETVPDTACQVCHDGPKHNEFDIDRPHCSECHREHRGRVALARVPDLNCTVCHADLKAHHKAPEKTRFDNVTGFPTGHPEFGLWRGTDPAFPGSKDPGKLRFNHAVHLVKDGVLVPERGNPDSTRREVLECGACHVENDAGYMKPIKHEEHCARCHEGQRGVRLAGHFADPDLGKDQVAEAARAGATLRKEADAFAAVTAPHLPAKEIRDRLNGRLIEFLVKNPVDAGSALALDRPWPRATDEMVWQPLDRPMLLYQRERFIPPQLAHMERMLFDRPGGCRFCHLADPARDTPDVVWDTPRPPSKLPEFLQTNMPSRWFPLSIFNHQRHRMLSCTECHPATNSTKTEDVLMPKLELCANCHSPAGNARYDCAECHKYHDRVHYPEQPRNNTIQELLRK